MDEELLNLDLIEDPVFNNQLGNIFYTNVVKTASY